jgi:Leucine-rich repeat (LRR) protein
MQSRRDIEREVARIARQVRSGDPAQAAAGLAVLRAGSLALYTRLLAGTTIKRSGRLVAGPVFSFVPDAVGAGVGRCALLVALAEAPPEALPEGVALSAVTRLDLSALELTAIPEQLGAFVGLRRLDLSFNLLTALPASLSRLTALEWLDLRGNPINAIPEELEGVTVLSPR